MSTPIARSKGVPYRASVPTISVGVANTAASESQAEAGADAGTAVLSRGEVAYRQVSTCPGVEEGTEWSSSTWRGIALQMGKRVH